MSVPFLNQTTGQLEYYDPKDLTPEALPLLQARGLRQATPEDVANRERTLEYSTVGQQALAQAERIVRGATLGQVEGIGSDEDIRARAEVSQDVSPVLSAAADFVPDVALGALTGGAAALATGAGRAAARGAVGLGARALLGAAAEAAPVAALAGEAVAGGAVTASQQAFQEGRQFFRENPVEDATNTLMWSGIGGVLGGAPMAFRALRGGGKVAREAAEALDEADLAAARAAGAADYVPPKASTPEGVPLAPDAGPSTAGVPLTSDEGTNAAYAAANGMEARPLSPKAQEILDRHREQMAAAGAAVTSEPVTAKRWVATGKKAQKGIDEDTAQALKTYGESGHQGVNALLRDLPRREKNDGYFREMADKVTRYLDGQVEAGNTVPGTVYRGVKEADFPTSLKPGDEWSDSGILSTTRDLTAAQNFGGGVVLELEQETGVPFLRKSGTTINREQEVLVRPGTKFEVVSDEVRKAPNGQDRRFVKLREKKAAAAEPGSFQAPLTDVRLPDSEGMLEAAAPEAAQKHAAEIQSVADTAVADKSLEDLNALPLEGAESRAKVDAFKGDKSFRDTGMLPGNNDRSRGGLPSFNVEADGTVSLNNGRHRLTAAKESGQEFIVANVKRYDADGNTVWDYVGPVRVNKPVVAETEGSLARAIPEVQPKVERPQAILVSERGVAKAERNAVRSQADDIVRKAAKGEEPLGRLDGYLRDSKLAQYQPEIIETATKEMRNDLNELNRLSQGIRERAVKQEDVAKNIADNLPAQQAKARDIAIAGQRLAGSIMADARALGEQMGKRPQYFSGTARDLTSSLIERTKAIAQMTDGAEIFNALDDLKRVVDNHKVALEAGSRKSAKDPLRYQALIPRVEEFANSVRSTLEDVPTFGRAGEMQKAYNDTYHQKWFPAKQVFEDSVFRRTGRDYKAFDTLDAWESKVTNLLENAGTGERRTVGDMLGALKEMAEQRAKYGTAPKAETDRIVGLVDKIERTFKLADDATAAKGRLETLMPVGQVVGSGIGAAVGGLPGAILGGGIAKGVTELATGKYRRAFMAMRGATEETVERSVDDWIKVSKGRAMTPGGKGMRFPKLELSPEDKSLLKTARRMGVTFGFAEFLGDNKDPQSAFTTKRDALMDDEGFVNRFADEFGDLATEEPQVYAVAAGKAGEVRKFLLDRLPSSVAVSMARPNGYPPTNEAIEDWSVYWNAATNPRSTVQSLARGDIRPQEIETLRTLYRPLYEKLQATLIDKISNATNMGDDLDDQFVMRMSLLFDLDGAGTPAFSQRAANVARQSAPPQQTQPSKPFAPKAGARVSPSNVAITGPTYGSIG